MKLSSKPRFTWALSGLALAFLTVPTGSWAQEDDSDDKQADKKKDEPSAIVSEVNFGLYYSGEDSDRYGKFSGLTDEGAELQLDFRIEKRPDATSSDTVRWRLQGWRLGLDSRRLEFAYNDQGKQKFRLDYREIPNNRFSDGQTPYRAEEPGLWQLAPGWEVAPGSSNILGFTNLQDSLIDLKVDTERQRLDLSYHRKLSAAWRLNVDWKHETKEGTRTVGGIFGFTIANARGAILAAPVDWTTDIVEAMIEYATPRLQFGIGAYASFFSNDEESFTFQNAYGFRNGWAPGVEFPNSFGRMALEPDNSYLQLKMYGGVNMTRSTRLTADFSFGKMDQNEDFLPYSVNPALNVHTPLPRNSVDAEVNTTMLNLRLTSRLARRLGLAVNYHYDDRDNETPRDLFPYIGGDAQDQRRVELGRINLPYSYTKHRADVTATYRFARAARFKAGIEYSDYSRDFQEVSDSDEFTWLAGIALRGWSHGSLTADVRQSKRDVKEYNGNAPLIASHLPGVIDDDEHVNNPLLRKYFLADRDRDELRFRADLVPSPEINLGLAGSYAEDDYSESEQGLTRAEVLSVTVDAGWYPQKHVSLTGFYTREEYDASQAGNSFFNPASPSFAGHDWFADSEDRVDTWNVALTFSDIGAGRGWNGIDLGFDYTYSDTRSDIAVTSPTTVTAPLPTLKAELTSFTVWGSARLSSNSSIRLAAESAELTSRDWALDGVQTDTLANVLLLGQSSANYDLWLISASWRYQF